MSKLFFPSPKQVVKSTISDDTSNALNAESDITHFIRTYRTRINKEILCDDGMIPNTFTSFARRYPPPPDCFWQEDNEKRFFKETPNCKLEKRIYLSEMGFIYCMEYSLDGAYLVCGHSTGLIQMESTDNMKINYPMFSKMPLPTINYYWVKENYEKFLLDTPNEISQCRWFATDMGPITALAYSKDGSHLVVGHGTGMIQLRDGLTGIVLKTLRRIQFPPKPIYAIHFSKTEDKVCYAACMDGNVYRIDLPPIVEEDYPDEYSCLIADPALESLTTEYFSTTSDLNYCAPFIRQRIPALCFGINADQTKMLVGYSDWALKIYDMETQACVHSYKVAKTRLQFIPEKLRRTHCGQICALSCDEEKATFCATAGWDRTLRLWDTRCEVGCITTLEGVNVCSDSIDLCRETCITGSWQPTEALTVWDLTARKRKHIVRVQNRRPDIDGEYICACKFWKSTLYNRKGKYAIIGGSGTQAVEVINLHNRYISCSYPAEGVVNAITSYQERIAFGGSAPVIQIVTFHDPKHERYVEEQQAAAHYERGDVQFDDEREYMEDMMHDEMMLENTETMTATDT